MITLANVMSFNNSFLTTSAEEAEINQFSSVTELEVYSFSNQEPI